MQFAAATLQTNLAVLAIGTNPLDLSQLDQTNPVGAPDAEVARYSATGATGIQQSFERLGHAFAREGLRHEIKYAKFKGFQRTLPMRRDDNCVERAGDRLDIWSSANPTLI